jgi:hypothetical protein
MLWRVNLYRSALMLILLVASMLEGVGGCQRPSNSTRRHADSLLVAPSAINPSYLAYPDGREQLTYTIDTDYPADSTISFLSTQLQNRRWTPLRQDFLDPDIPSSEVRGWMQFEDATREPRATVRQWSVDWEDGARNITLYDLKYRYPVSGAHDPPDSRMLHVVALYIPANIVEKMKSNIAEKMKHISRPDKPKQ